MEEPLVLDYRGEHIEFNYDDAGMSVYASWRDREYNFGFANMSYKEDMMCIIDNVLDTITRFENYPEFHGCRLAWQFNGTHRDIMLTYRLRILKVFLVADEKLVDLEAIKNEAVKILHKIILANRQV